MHTNDRSDLGLVARILMNTFGVPKGVLGRLGGKVMARSNQEVAQWAVELLAIGSQDQVLEIGFGPGVAIELIAQRLGTGSVVGIDYSEEMVAQARARNQEAIEAGLVELKYGSAAHLPYGDDRFDKALTINSMQLWPDPESGLAELRRVMKRAGKMAAVFTQRARPRPQNEELSELIRSAGFDQVRIEARADAVCAVAVKP
jgi:SAM-dependent methyltransferase